MKSIYYNGSVYTGQLPLTEAFIVEDGRFTHTGTSGEMLSLACVGDLKIDLQGKFVCAGFNDSHMHLLSLGLALTRAKLNEHTGSLEELVQHLIDFAR